MKYFLTLASWLLLTCATALPCLSQERPNIVWITAEDMSPTLGCYGDEYARTPNIDGLAQQSTRYTHAFATAPVCSPSRSCLITGCYAPSMGTQQMRSAFPIPDFIRGFPALLRDIGYYTTNNFKTDYNTSSAERIIADSWNESSTTAHWRNRGKGKESKPFFSVFNLMTSHQSRSMVWSQERFRREVQSKLSNADVHDPSHAIVPPYYPDTPVTRRIWARYYDCVTAMDAEVGSILSQLKEDRLDDNTIVFFYSDHGSGMPRHKRLLHDSGMHVPLLVRFPKKWAHLAATEAGETTDRIVSFVDFPPTILRLLDIQQPEYMQGIPFLGKGSNQPRQFAFGHRDRIDEVMDLSRSVRDKQYLYIRNFMPHKSWNQYSSYSDLSEIRHELYYLAEKDEGTQPQLHFAGPRKPAEELYDCVADPLNLNNLAGKREYRKKQDELDAVLVKHLRDSQDLGFLAESDAWELFAESTPWQVARDGAFASHGLPAMQAAMADDSSLVELLKSDLPSNRFWGAVRLSGGVEMDKSTRGLLKLLRDDTAASVRIEAANALARHGDMNIAVPRLIAELNGDNMTSVLHATRTIELLGSAASVAAPAMQHVAKRSEKLTAADTQAVFDQSGDRDLAMFCAFAANGFLQRLNQGPWIDLLGTEHHDAWTNRTDGVSFFKAQSEVEMLSKGKNLWIVHERQFGDFELTAEVEMPAEEYNAGIGFRCQLTPSGKPKGYQCEIAEEKSGGLYAIGSGGWVWPKDAQQQAEFNRMMGEAFRSGQWNHLRILCRGSAIQIWVNGILATDVKDETHREGHIALQHHGTGGVHRYRNVRIRELDVAQD